MELEENFPTLELKEYIPPSMIEEYEQMSCSRDLLPCRHSLPEVTSLQFASWLSRLAVERMQRKQAEVVQTVCECHHNWQEAVFRYFVANFGFNKNASAFELLSKSLPYRYILKHKDSRLQIYALVFGQAGLLEQPPDEPDRYFETLQSEYDYLKYKYNLVPIPLKVWNAAASAEFPLRAPRSAERVHLSYARTHRAAAPRHRCVAAARHLPL